MQLFPSTTTPGGLYPLRRLSLLIAGLYTSIAAVWIIGAAFSFSAKNAENPVQIKDAWFAAFAPAEKARLAIGVLLIEAEAAGGEVAAPIASEVLSAGL